MDPEKQREIARKGGKAAHEKGTAHEFTADEARAAGRKGGERVSSNREHMSRIGRLGGKSSATRRASPDFSSESGNEQGSSGAGRNENSPGTSQQEGNLQPAGMAEGDEGSEE
jgi:general stress protein YciG